MTGSSGDEADAADRDAGTGSGSGGWGDPSHHGGGRSPKGKGRIDLRIAYVLAVVAAAATLFFLVPDGGSWAFLVLFGGLMALHHVPGLSRGSRPGVSARSSGPPSGSRWRKARSVTRIEDDSSGRHGRARIRGTR